VTKKKRYSKVYRLLPHGRNLLKVRATCGGNNSDIPLYRINLLVDTGASLTILPVDALKDLNYAIDCPLRYNTVVTGSGTIRTPIIPVTWFNCIGQTVDNFEVAAYNIPVALGIDGVLGMDFLDRFRTIISVAEAPIRSQ